MEFLNSDSFLPIEDLLQSRSLRSPEQLARQRIQVFYEEVTYIHRPSLLDWLYTVSFREYTDPRDIIFAMTGFWEDERPSIEVKYQLSVEEIYGAFSRHCFLASRLQILCFAGIEWSPTPSSGLPTWVADWRHETTRSNWPRELRYECYSAGITRGHKGPAPRIGDRGTSMMIQGVICDVVTAKQNNGSWRDEDEENDPLFATSDKWGPEKKYVTGMPFVRQASALGLLISTSSLGFASSVTIHSILPEWNCTNARAMALP